MYPFPTAIDELHAILQRLLDENAALKARIAELEAQLKADSHNSHQPPSADGLRKRSAMPKPSGRVRGGQRGHRGQTLALVTSPDHTITCTPDVCPCGASGQQESVTVLERRQVFDLPEPRLIVTEYQRLRCQCLACGRVREGVFPSSVTAPTQYGAGVLAAVTLLNSGYLLPFKKVQGLFADLFGDAINEHTMARATARCYEALAASELRIRSQIQEAPVCHFDETGIRVAGHLSWYHVATTPSFTYAFVHAHRGGQALTSPDSLFSTYSGWAVHDCWASYFASLSCRHALCGAHLLRELTAVAEHGRQWAAQMHTFLLVLYHRSEGGTRPLPDMPRWNRIYDTLCQQADWEEPPPTRHSRTGKRRRTPGRNLLGRLRNYKSAVLAFARYAEVPFTNNQAERDVRPVKVKQKIAGCFRTLEGAKHYARISSVISTLRKQHCQVFNELRHLFLGHAFVLAPVGAK